MKIVSIDEFGTIEFKPNGGAFIDGWAFTLDDVTREPDTDELVLMLYEFLAAHTRTHMLNRLSLTTALQTRVQ